MIAASVAVTLALSLLAAGPEAAPAAAPAPAAAAGADPAAALPEPVRPFLTMKAKDGTPYLTEDDKAKLFKLPERSRQLLGAAVDSQILGSPQQLHNLLGLGLASPQLDLVLQDNCILCHSDPQNQKGKTLFHPDPKTGNSNPLLNLKEFVSDVHFRRGLSCSGCHGGKPTDESMTDAVGQNWPKDADARHKDRTWIPAFCAKCHSDSAFMRDFNPALPTDQLTKYQESRHGKLVLEAKDSRAAQCVSCHGVHGIRGPKSRMSTVSPQRVPDTCGACHASPEHMAGFMTEDGQPLPTTQVAEYKNSVHGKAVLVKNDQGAPSCTGCHGSHAAMPPSVASVAQVCRRCHVLNGQLFDGSKHKVAFEQHKWPECAQCHGKHGIAKPTEAMIGDQPGTLCHDCHVKNSGDNQKCDKTAATFRTTLDGLATGRTEAAGEEEELARKGLDIEPLTRAVGDLDEGLTQARRSVHSFEMGAFQQAAAPATEALGKAKDSIATAKADHQFRRNGLVGAMGFMLLLAGVIALKLRGIEKDREDEEKKGK
jgi:hypothetical protein